MYVCMYVYMTGCSHHTWMHTYSTVLWIVHAGLVPPPPGGLSDFYHLMGIFSTQIYLQADLVIQSRSDSRLKSLFKTSNYV